MIFTFRPANQAFLLGRFAEIRFVFKDDSPIGAAHCCKSDESGGKLIARHHQQQRRWRISGWNEDAAGSLNGLAGQRDT